MITLQKARQALEAAENKAKELGTAITITIVDTHGSVIATIRMDGAIPISPRFAFEKAFTSANLGTPTKDLAKFAIEGKPYFGLTDIFGGEMTTIAGGRPIIMEGKVVGAVGVGGSMDVGQDDLCAEEAVRVLS